MRVPRSFLATGAIAASLVGGSAAAVVDAPPVGASTEFTLIAHRTNVEFITAHGSFVPSGPPPPDQPPPPPGDRAIIREDLTQGGVTVGFATIICTVTFNNNLLCDAIYSFDGRGDLHVATLHREGAGPIKPAVFDLMIDGGTFNFRNTRGDIHIVELPNGDTQETFNIV